MAKTTVKDLAADLNLPVETLLSQLKEAGLSQSTPADELSEADNESFLNIPAGCPRQLECQAAGKITLTKQGKERHHSERRRFLSRRSSGSAPQTRFGEEPGCR